MEGYSVAKRGDWWIVIRDGMSVAVIKLSTFDGKPVFDWHDKFMWSFRACDFILI